MQRGDGQEERVSLGKLKDVAVARDQGRSLYHHHPMLRSMVVALKGHASLGLSSAAFSVGLIV